MSFLCNGPIYVCCNSSTILSCNCMPQQRVFIISNSVITHTWAERNLVLVVFKLIFLSRFCCCNSNEAHGDRLCIHTGSATGLVTSLS